MSSRTIQHIESYHQNIKYMLSLSEFLRLISGIDINFGLAYNLDLIFAYIFFPRNISVCAGGERTGYVM